MTTKIFRKEADDALFVSRLYRKIIEDGFHSLTALNYSRLHWGDQQIIELAETLQEVRFHRLPPASLCTARRPFESDRVAATSRYSRRYLRPS